MRLEWRWSRVMSRICPKCGKENSDEALWCSACNKRLVENLTKTAQKNSSGKQTKQPQLDKKSYQDLRVDKPAKIGRVAKSVIGVVVVLVVIAAGWYLFHSISDETLVSCTFGQDFWFEENQLITRYGWNFTVTPVEDSTVEGIVLAVKQYGVNEYPYKVVNLFSPVDVFIGIDDVQENPTNYPYLVNDFTNRVCYVKYTGGSIQDMAYFQSHTGTVHIIPHTSEVANNLSEIDVKDIIRLEGMFVDLYGKKGDDNYVWETDNMIGNFESEIFLVDTIFFA